IGLDAEVVRRVEEDPKRYDGGREWLFLKHALTAASTSYRTTSPKLRVTVEGEQPVEAVLAVCCNARPLTYFKNLPMDVCPEAHLDEGLDLFALTKIRIPTVPRVIWSTFVSRSHPKWRNGQYFHDRKKVSFDTYEPLPVQVDGDYVGKHPRGEIELVPASLDLFL
ncbi:MAG: diacylglycerol/lipid kinase family protein, partial [Actinomycetota bacterium]